MLTTHQRSRYSKQTILPEIGIAGQELLLAAKVLVIGAGGLGCPVLQYLTATGIGTIGVADGDTIDVSNLQRQVLYNVEEIGQLKAEVAVSKLKKQNPDIQFSIYPEFINADNALQILRNYDIIVDGSDNFATRYLVNDACVILNKPMVSGAIYKFEGQLSVFNYKGGPTYRCIFPEPPADSESPNCADIGVAATLPGIIGTLQANEVIKMITGAGDVLSGRLLVIDTLAMNTHIFNFKLNKANLNITSLSGIAEVCNSTPGKISYEQLQTLLQSDSSVQLVDVRETEEHQISNIGGINIPLSVLDQEHHQIKQNDTVVVYCSSGTRSNNAAKRLILQGFTKVLNLENGINHLSL